MEASGPVLPDITNYYTLFPKTLPGGPPQPKSRVPDSSTVTEPNQPPPTFHINPRELRKEFLQLQSLHHPDKFPAGSVAHQRAYALSTLLNNAYKTLSDPLSRSQYLLQELYDIDVTSEDNSAHPSDPETLMVVMEAQEELEGAGREGGEEIVQNLKDENNRRIFETEKELGAAFEAGEKDEARDQSVKLKYWKSLQSGLQEWEPGKEVRLTH
jgi:molecular chaperone HscB